MPKTTLNDLQKVIDEQAAEIERLKKELNLMQKMFIAIKILVNAMSESDGL